MVDERYDWKEETVMRLSTLFSPLYFKRGRLYTTYTRRRLACIALAYGVRYRWSCLRYGGATPMYKVHPLSTVRYFCNTGRQVYTRTRNRQSTKLWAFKQPSYSLDFLLSLDALALQKLKQSNWFYPLQAPSQLADDNQIYGLWTNTVHRRPCYLSGSG